VKPLQVQPELEPLILAFVEEEPLSTSQAAALQAALAASPALSASVKAMRSDRAALVALGATSARVPADLLARVDVELSELAALALASQQQSAAASACEPASLPISIVQPADRSVRSAASDVLYSFAHSRWSGRLATAAALALLVGGGVMLARVAIQSLPKVAPRPIAAVNPVLPALPALPALASLADGPAPIVNPGPVTTIAATDTTEPITGDPALPLTADPTNPPAPAIAAAVPTAKPVAELSLARAVELANQGRLGVCIEAAHSRHAKLAADLVAALAKRPGRQFAVRSDSTGETRTVIATLNLAYRQELARAGYTPGTSPKPSPADPAIIAGTDGSTPPPALPGASLPATDPFANVPTELRFDPSSFVVALDPSEAVLQSMLRGLSSRGATGARFVELPAAAAQPATTPASLQPNEVLWWTQPAATWGRKAAVPVVISLPN